MKNILTGSASDDKLLRVAAYARVSTRNDQYGSLEAQMSYYNDMIQNNPDWVNAGVYGETCSGKNLEGRAEFRKLLAKCRRGKVDIILTKAVSRFARNALDAIAICREFIQRGIDVWFEVENLKLSALPTMFHLEVYCAFAQGELYSKSEDIKAGIRFSFKTGTSGFCNFKCYGYDKGKDGLIVNAKQADVVRMIFDFRVNGCSLNAISNELSKVNILSPTGKESWSRETLNKILKNEKYCGHVLLQKTFVEDYLTGKQVKNRGECDQVLIRNSHEPIIDDKLFLRVNDNRMW